MFSTPHILELLEAAADLLRRAPHTRLFVDEVGNEAVALWEAAKGARIARVTGLVLQKSWIVPRKWRKANNKVHETTMMGRRR